MNFSSLIFKKVKTAFIVEDNTAFAQVLKAYLVEKFRGTLEFMVFPAGEICLAELHRNPAVIIVDYFLGTERDDAVTGLETVLQIRAQKSEANIIILSAWREEELPFETIKNCNYTYVEKNLEAFKKVEKIIRSSLHL